ncbi:hypothetical protein BH11PSE11_BH11PSE11_03290 [soil metagenome]
MISFRQIFACLVLCCSLAASHAATAGSASSYVNYSDIWWNPNESGWGLTLADHDTQMFGVWYTYDADGHPTWFVIPGGSFTESKRFFSADLYQTTGPAYNLPFDASKVSATKVGQVQMDFAPPAVVSGIALFTFTVGGVTQTRQVQRQSFGNAAPLWSYDYSDIWWAASESGWGLSLAQHGSNVFGVWYTYDLSGKPLWVVMPGVSFTSGNGFTGKLYTTTGPWYGNAVFDASKVVAAEVGSASTSIYGASGAFSATMNGYTQSKAITRQSFGNTTASGTCTPPPPAAGAAAGFFKASPIDINEIRWITPLGNINPPDHPLPTDHIYFYFANPDQQESPVQRRTAFFAPADGTVTDIFHNSTVNPDIKIFVKVSETTSYYIDHLIPEVAIAKGTVITAGQRLGTTGSAYGVDIGVINSAVTQGFVKASRYTNGDSLHADAPLKYFDEPLRSQLYAKVQRLGTECDGKINYDVAGTLSGNWFIEFGTAPLSFAYDTYDPTQVRISAPGVLTKSGVFSIASGDPAPSNVSLASGKVQYTLSYSRTGPPTVGDPVARLLVQMLDSTRIKVEIFNLPSSAVDFTANARVFVR